VSLRDRSVALLWVSKLYQMHSRTTRGSLKRVPLRSSLSDLVPRGNPIPGCKITYENRNPVALHLLRYRGNYSQLSTRPDDALVDRVSSNRRSVPRLLTNNPGGTSGFFVFSGPLLIAIVSDSDTWRGNQGRPRCSAGFCQAAPTLHAAKTTQPAFAEPNLRAEPSA
jgi:hypothetical protein